MNTTKVINISLPSDMLDEADEVAKSEFRTRSEFFREAVRSYILKKQLNQIYREGRKTAEKMGIKEEDVDRLIHEYRQSKNENRPRY